MSNNPGDTPDGNDSGGQNPFKGTPFEQLFGGLMGGGAGRAAGGMPDLNQLFSQIQFLMQPHEGAVNWDFALDIARKTVAQTPDPTPSSGSGTPSPTRSGWPTTGSTRRPRSHRA